MSWLSCGANDCGNNDNLETTSTPMVSGNNELQIFENYTHKFSTVLNDFLESVVLCPQFEKLNNIKELLLSELIPFLKNNLCMSLSSDSSYKMDEDNAKYILNRILSSTKEKTSYENNEPNPLVENYLNTIYSSLLESFDLEITGLKNELQTKQQKLEALQQNLNTVLSNEESDKKRIDCIGNDIRQITEQNQSAQEELITKTKIASEIGREILQLRHSLNCEEESKDELKQLEQLEQLEQSLSVIQKQNEQLDMAAQLLSNSISTNRLKILALEQPLARI